MKLITRFIENAGLGNALRCLVVLVVLAIALSKDAQSELILITGPAAALGLIVPYFFRERLVNHLEVVGKVMNTFVIAAIAATIFLPKFTGGEPAPLRIALSLVFSLYVGAYFWMLSDERIIRTDRF